MELESILKERGIDYCIPDTADIPSDIPDTVIIIKNYRPLNASVDFPTINITLAVNSNSGFSPKTWLNYEQNKIRKINSNAPKYHPDYKSFIFSDCTYYPYSINVQSFSFSNVVNLLDNLYNHINL